MSFRAGNQKISYFNGPPTHWIPIGLKTGIVSLIVFVLSLQYAHGVVFASSPLILVVAPASFNANTDCPYSKGQGWTCTATLSRGDSVQQNLIWSSHSNGIRGVSFSPQGGSLAPGATQSVSITIPDSVCPTQAVFSFVGPGNTDQVPWNCGGPLLTVDTTSFTAGGNCPVGQGGWTCSTNVGESSSAQGSLKWSANTSLTGVTFSPANGTLMPGMSTSVSIFVPTSACKNANFNFVGKNSNIVRAQWICYTAPPPPTLTVSPTTLYPKNCTLNGGSEQCTVSFGETSSSKGSVNWTSGSTLSGVTFSPAKGILSPGETINVVIGAVSCQNGTFTFFGNKGATPVAIAWNCTTPPVLTVTPTTLDPTSSNCSGGMNNPQCMITLGETPDSQGSLNWSASSSLSYVNFMPQTGTISQGATEQVTIAAILCKYGTFTFTGPANSIMVSWSCALPHGTITEYPIPTSQSGVVNIAAGSDGNLWFTEYYGNKIGRINPATGAITEYPVSGSSWGITAGPDGNLWFIERSGNKIGRINPSGGVVTEFPIPTASSDPMDITAGPDGNLWFTERSGNNIGRITPGGTITEYPLPTSASSPSGITSGPDGNLWFTEFNVDKIGQITPGGTITEYSIPTSNSEPEEITAGPDGNLWFTEIAGNNIGQITPGGTITEYSTPTNFSHPYGITTGPDGNLWFTEIAGNNIGRITPGGTITEYPLPTSQRGLQIITAGPDGNLWFTEALGNNIGRIVP